MKNRMCAIFSMVLALLLGTVFPVSAATGGGAESRQEGQTDILAGVVVDYMGKLRFEVKEEGTLNPIPGASVEIWIPGINGGQGAYVLFGVTDEQGVLELDVAYDTGGKENQFVTVDGKLTFGGSLLYLSGNQLRYQVYKAGWRPYPKTGEVALEAKEVPQVVTVLLYKPSGGSHGGGSGGGGSHGGGRADTDQSGMTVVDETPQYDRRPDGSQIPKTGVENYALFWGLGCGALLAAALLVVRLLAKERGRE